MQPSEVKKAAFAMPLTSPSYPKGPYRYQDREHLAITYRTDAAALRRIVPEPLELAGDRVRCEFLRMRGSTGFGKYSGAAQSVPVTFGGEAGSYTLHMFLDVHAPISGGRELWGFPQKLASPRLSVEHDTLVGTLDYGPRRVASGTMGYKHKPLAAKAAAGLLAEPGFLLKIIPHVDGTPRLCQLVRYTRSKIGLSGAWTGPAALELHPHALAPLSDLPVREVVSGVHFIADFTLDLGTVVHDYLA